MPPPASSAAQQSCRRLWGGVAAIMATVLLAVGWLADARPSFAQGIAFPERPKPIPRATPQPGGQEQMLVRAEVINYDYTNERVSAIGNVQIYYGASTLEADKVIYDQKTKRLHAEGNVRLTQADGTVTYGEIMDLSDDFRDGFVDSLRLDGPEQTRFAAARADRSSGNYTVFQSGVYTACEPCKDDPRKPPKWQVKAARIIHDQGEKMMYFEDAALEFFGMPLAYLPYFSAPDPTVKRKTGVLVPSVSSSSVYGYAVTVPYYWALAPDYDFTFTPMITSQAGPAAAGRVAPAAGERLLQHPRVRHLPARQGRVPEGRPADAGLSRLARQHRNVRPVQPDRRNGSGAGTARCCRTRPTSRTTACRGTCRPPTCCDRRRTMRCRSSTSSDAATAATSTCAPCTSSASRPPTISSQIPIIHPVMDHDYVFKNPIFGGELSLQQQPDQPVARHGELRSDFADRRDRRPVLPDDRGHRLQEHQQLSAARRARHLHALVVGGDLEDAR